jgi:hypothetical protein
MAGKSFAKDMSNGAMSSSTAARQARSGKDMGKPGPGFKKVQAKAAAEYGSEAAGKRVAGAVFQKMRKAGKL